MYSYVPLLNTLLADTHKRACILPELIPLDQGEQIQMIHGFSERANW